MEDNSLIPLQYPPILMAKTLFGEARGEVKRYGIVSFIAIANVIVNRFLQQTWYGQTLDEVCLKRGQFSCWNPKDPNRSLLDTDLSKSILYQKALYTSEQVISARWPDVTDGADHYHALGGTPSWTKAMTQTVVIGSHRFYRSK